MDKQSIILYIRMHGGTEIPALQQQFDLSYRAARDLVNELVNADKLTFEHGVHYTYNDNRSVVASDESASAPMPDETNDDYFEKRRAELIKRLRAEYDDYYDNNEYTDDDDYDDGDEFDSEDDKDDEDDEDDYCKNYRDIKNDLEIVNIEMEKKLAELRERDARREPVDKSRKEILACDDIRLSLTREQTLRDLSNMMHDYSRNLEDFTLPEHNSWQDNDKLELCVMDRLAYIVEGKKGIALTDARHEAIKMRVALEGDKGKAFEACELLEYYLNQCSNAGFNLIAYVIHKDLN